MKDDYKLIVEQLREWLRQGATISAADPRSKQLLEPDAEGRWFGGLLVIFPKK